jgi:hypothetical protein
MVCTWITHLIRQALNGVGMDHTFVSTAGSSHVKREAVAQFSNISPITQNRKSYWLCNTNSTITHSASYFTCEFRLIVMRGYDLGSSSRQSRIRVATPGFRNSCTRSSAVNEEEKRRECYFMYFCFT